MDRIPTGVAALDSLLQGGFPGGSTILIAGKPGTGKTILAHQLMYRNASPDFKCLYLTTLAEPQVKVMRFQQEFSYFDKDKFQKSIIYADLGGTLRKHGVRQTLGVIDSLLREHQPKIAVIDTMKIMADMIPSVSEFREFVLDLSLRLNTWGATALLVGEYSEEEIDTRPESGIADGIIYLSGTEERKTQKRYLRVLKMRGTAYTGGQNVFKITSDGIDVYPRLVADVNTQSYKQFETRLSSGWKGLDDILNGGIPNATLTMVSGATGTGKTLLGLGFVWAAAKAKEPSVYVTFEENPEQIIHVSKGLGMDIQPYVKRGLITLIHVSPAELDVDEHLYHIQKTVKACAAKRLVVDSITSFEIGMRDKIKYTDFLWALTDYYKSQGITVLVTCETENGLSYSPHHVSFLADNIIHLRHSERDSHLERTLRVVKVRSSKHDEVARKFRITDHGLEVDID